jgi:ABC-2 type transport system ATP-binding protein
MHEISAHTLTKDFGDVRAVDSLSFTVEPGRIVGFLGPNGSGKTTTLRMLLGLVRPTAGRALIGGRPYRELRYPAREVGAVLEARAFHVGRTGRDHLRVVAAEAGVSPRRIDEVLALVELGEAGDRRAGGYSLGMGQRLSLAAAMLGDPGTLILDEPINGLDPRGIRWLRDFLRDLAAQGRTVLLSSHLLAEVELTVDEVIILDAGRGLAHRSLRDIRAGAGSLESVFLELTETSKEASCAR